MVTVLTSVYIALLIRKSCIQVDGQMWQRIRIQHTLMGALFAQYLL
jgi:hypothetical protein